MHSVGPRPRRAQYYRDWRTPIVCAQTSTRTRKFGQLTVLSRSRRKKRFTGDPGAEHRQRSYQSNVSRRPVETIVQRRGRVRPVG